MNSYFISKGFIAAGFYNVTPKEAFFESQKNAILVDVREEELTGYKCFNVPKVFHIPFSRIIMLYSQLPMDIPLIIADSVGLKSKEAMIFLANKGYENIANMAGGIVEWERDELPLKIDNTEKLDGSCMCQLRPRNKKNKLMKKRILILCTGNSCRSQMAEAFLKSFNKNAEGYSAGTKPTGQVNPFAIKVMQEVGLDISKNTPKNVSEFLSAEFDYVITVCDGAKESCPVFIGKVKNRLHMGFEDPADAKGTQGEIMNVFRKVRDQIREEFFKFNSKI